MRKLSLIFVALSLTIVSYCQSAWPSVNWANANNISPALPTTVVELSGLYWNNDTKRLFAVGDAGYFAALQFNTSTNQFTFIGSVKNSDGPEGITQVNNKSNEFYTIDESSYEIRKYSFNSTFSSITKLNSWNLLASPSPMSNTDNTGPEGICFVPDSHLQKVGFISSATGQVYTSKKGMGGLLLIAHQDGGYIWVFDVNPAVNNDFAYVGKYLTNRSESCDVSFDTSTGLIYILHNTDNNLLEVSNLKTTVSGEIYSLTKLKEYYIPNPASGSDNIEGFAISPKFPTAESQGVWLCRDVTKTTEVADALKWFKPYTADGTDIRTSTPYIRMQNYDFSLSLTKNGIQISTTTDFGIIQHTAKLYNVNGQLISTEKIDNYPFILCQQELQTGIYILKISKNNETLLLQKISRTR